MTNINTEEVRALLNAEHDHLQEELARHGRKSTDTGDWQGSSDEIEPDADSNIVADNIEELATNVPVVEALEERLRNVERALEKIDEGTYGICDVGGEAIPPERLKANPAAVTCIEHTR